MMAMLSWIVTTQYLVTIWYEDADGLVDIHLVLKQIVGFGHSFPIKIKQFPHLCGAMAGSRPS